MATVIRLRRREKWKECSPQENKKDNFTSVLTVNTMSEGKVSSSDAFSPRSKKASAAEDTLQNRDMDGAGDIRTFEFDECSGDFGVVFENKDPCSPSRARTALGNIRIADLLPDSRAKRDGMLEVGDRVMEINGRDLSKASLERAR